MARYRRRMSPPPNLLRSAADWFEPTPLVPTLSVDESGPEDIGIFDSQGFMIQRLPESIGFLTFCLEVDDE